MDLLVAFILDCIFGDPYNFPHPVKLIGRYINFFKSNVICKDSHRLKICGMILTFTTVSFTFLSTYILLYFVKSINIYLFHILNSILLWTTIAPKCLSQECYRVYRYLKANDLEKARIQISYLVSRDTQNLNSTQISRAAIETVFENTSDGVIAPLFFALLGGAPLAMAYKAVNTLDSMVGYHNQKYEHFGYFSAKTDDIFNFIPARISGILIVLSSAIAGCNWRNSFKIFMRDRLNHTSPNSAHPEAAGAGALEIQLGGATSYFGKIHDKPSIGDMKFEIVPEHIVKSVKLMYISAIIFISIYVLISICISN